MRIYKDYPINYSYIETQLDKIFCDICKEEMDQTLDREVKISCEEFYGTDEGGYSSNVYGIDCCVNCFITKVKPIIEKELNINLNNYK